MQGTEGGEGSFLQVKETRCILILCIGPESQVTGQFYQQGQMEIHIITLDTIKPTERMEQEGKEAVIAVLMLEGMVENLPQEKSHEFLHRLLGNAFIGVRQL